LCSAQGPLVHPNLIAALADGHRRFHACGAVTGQTHQLRRNCLTSQIWRGHTSRSSQDAARNQANRIAGAWSRTPAISLPRTIGKVARSSC
jgi:hypothetical protein